MVGIARTVNNRTFRLVYNSGTDVTGIQYMIRVRSNVDGSNNIYSTTDSMINGFYQTEEIEFENGIYSIQVYILDAIFETITLIVDATRSRTPSDNTIGNSYFFNRDRI